MAVVAGRVLHNHKHVNIALTYIYGIGSSRSTLICRVVKIDPATKVRDLTEEELERIRRSVNQYIVEGDLRREVSMSVKRLMDLGCYRGIRHRRGLPCRGQRTRTNAHTRKKRRRS